MLLQVDTAPNRSHVIALRPFHLFSSLNDAKSSLATESVNFFSSYLFIDFTAYRHAHRQAFSAAYATWDTV